ncbi:hypothetical protein B0T19DRAFT_472578 [Cercophora scortea]|uniref:Uncharacterized protein n=1 Tax=Cercophora scortea TaxID=314031 RepID=A0AAE0J6A2_9PEZI|nr:hypothetical protein B0T19DRAFT_472578 [Cercophora scortea]
MIASSILLMPLLASVASCSGLLPIHKADDLASRELALPHAPRDILLHTDPSELQRRAEASETFDIGFQVQNQVLYEGGWEGALPKPVPIPGTPGEVQVSEKFEFKLECKDCRTYGTVTAAINTDDGFTASLTFNGAGAFLEFGLEASDTLTVTFTLGRFFDRGKNLTSGGIEAKIGLGLDLVLSLDTKVAVAGGFQLCIPDGAQLTLDAGLAIDPDSFLPTANPAITKVPDITFSLLPLALSTAQANITAALILKTDIGIGSDLGSVGAGAYLTLVQVKLGEVISSSPNQCRRAIFADIESSAGAYAHAELTLDNNKNDTSNSDPLIAANPSVGTVFATAGTTTCLDGIAAATPTTTLLPPAPSSLASSLTLTLPCGLAQQTTTTTTTATTTTQSITACLAPGVIICPASLTQLVVVTGVETLTLTSTLCPSLFMTPSYPLINATSNSYIYPTGTGTGTGTGIITTTTTPDSGALPTTQATPQACPAAASILPLLPLPSAIISSLLPPDFANLTLPSGAAATVTGGVVQVAADTVSTAPTTTITTPPAGPITTIATVRAGNYTATASASMTTTSTGLGRIVTADAGPRRTAGVVGGSRVVVSLIGALAFALVVF